MLFSSMDGPFHYGLPPSSVRYSQLSKQGKGFDTRVTYTIIRTIYICIFFLFNFTSHQNTGRQVKKHKEWKKIIMHIIMIIGSVHRPYYTNSLLIIIFFFCSTQIGILLTVFLEIMKMRIQVTTFVVLLLLDGRYCRDLLKSEKFYCYFERVVTFGTYVQ